MADSALLTNWSIFGAFVWLLLAIVTGGTTTDAVARECDDDDDVCSGVLVTAGVNTSRLRNFLLANFSPFSLNVR